jgi:hypothetical protein
MFTTLNVGQAELIHREAARRKKVSMEATSNGHEVSRCKVTMKFSGWRLAPHRKKSLCEKNTMFRPLTCVPPFNLWGLVVLAFLGLGTSPVWAAQTAATDEPLVLRFRDFYQSPIGPAGLQMSATLRAAHAQRVRLTGFMVAQEVAMAGYFFLTPLPVTMSAHADGESDDLPPSTVLVQMPKPESALPVFATPGLLQLTGRLQVGRFEMPDGRVVWLRLLLEPRAAPGL